jgi:D-alanyl-D-alanine carboxypeptidase/D-alanyl-D-alanine-endopeptidase (penicillin-binding protein 4)
MNPSRRSLVFWAVFVFVLAVPGSLSAANGLAAKIEEVINGPDYKQSRWGILIVDADSGQTLYEHEADKLCIPASVTKLYSCAAALVFLGPDYKFETPVYRRGQLVDHRLQGDLILVAQGDLTLGGRTSPDGRMAYRDSDHIYATSTGTRTELTETDPLAGLKELARQVRAAGITYVEGDVLVDDRLFAKARGSGSGPSILTPIMVNDNIVDVVVTPGSAASQPAAVRLVPSTSFVQMDAEVVTVEEGKATRIDVVPAGPQRFVIQGQIPLQSRPMVRIFPIEDPTAFARSLFIETLRQEGVTVKASPLQTPGAELPERDSYVRLPRVALFTSPPLSEAVKVTLKVSHNLYASTLPLLLAAKQGKRTLPEGLRLQRQVLADLGVDVGTISFAGGAGGANADAVTARATVQLLRGMAKRSEYAAFRAGLPVLGVDGTLADVVSADSPARGKVLAKTGTLTWHDLLNDRTLLTSKSVAGIMTTARGRSLAFALFVNNVPLPRGVDSMREGKSLGRLCEVIYREASEPASP